MRFGFKALKIFGIALLFGISAASIGMGIFTWYNTETAFKVITSLKPSPTPAPFHLKGVAVLGDSQSDEYRADDARGGNFDANTFNWVELLAKNRTINFGKWGTWGDGRRTGYKYNWAKTGENARSMIENGHHIRVAEQIKKGEVNAVVIFIGANEYAPINVDQGYDKIYNRELTSAQLIAKKNRIVSDIKSAIEVLQEAGDARILLVTIPDWRNSFVVSLAFPDPDGRERVSEEIAKVNQELIRMAENKGVTVLDISEFYRSLPKTKDGLSVQVGNVKLERLLINNDPRNMFLEDGVHAGTVMNGLFANAVIEKMNSSFGTQIKPLSNKEILSAAGIFE